MNHCIDAVIRDTLKLEKKETMYRKLGIIYSGGSDGVVCCAPFVELFASGGCLPVVGSSGP